MSFPSRVDTVYANEMSCTPVDSDSFNIVNTNGGEILLNGVAPGGGGGSLPIIGTGDITVQGNIRAQGDGVSTGKLEGEIIKATTGNIIATAGNVEVLAGNVEISGTGGLEVNGTGIIKTVGGGNITAGLAGDIQTTTGDIVSGNNIYFEGTDLFKRTENGGVVTNTSYKNFQGLVGLTDNNTFTGTNKFDDNTTEFSEKVSVGTRDGAGLFTQNLALNKSGNIESGSINNTNAITTGNINCDNGGTNSCAARLFTTRTSGVAGWTMEQQTVQGNALDNVLQMRGGQAGAYVSIVDSAFAGFVPNIALDPQTEVLGGLIQTDSYKIGDGANTFTLKQPKSGADSGNLLLQAGASEGPIKFQNNAGTTDLVIIKPDSVDNSGQLHCPAIIFGTSGGVHNSIVNDIAGPESLVLKIRQATASSEVIFEDNNEAELIRVRKTQIELKDDLPLLFGNYSFRPQQYSLTKTLTIAAVPDTATFTNMAFNCRTDSWTDVNSGATGVTLYNVALEGYYKCSISQTALSSAGNFNFCDIIFDYILRLSVQTTPDITYTEPRYGYRKKPINQAAPTIEIDHLNTPVQSQPVYVLYSGQNSGETMPIEVRLTKLDF